jgi:hypothetical protein
MTEFKPIRLRRGKLVHVTDVEDLRETACGKNCDGGVLAVDEAPNCKPCVRAVLDSLN